MAELVAAAGTLAGGAAAQAIMGEPKPYTGGGIAGVTATKSSGKDDKNAGIPQVDASQALEWYRQAADTQVKGYDQGLQYYMAGLDKARGEISAGFEKADNVLKPVSYASTQALNEQLRMMGIAPMSPSAGYAEKLGQLGNYADIQKQMTAAESIQDSGKRAEALAQVNQAFGSAMKDTAMSSQVAALQSQMLGQSTNDRLDPGTVAALAKGGYNLALAPLEAKGWHSDPRSNAVTVGYANNFAAQHNAEIGKQIQGLLAQGKQNAESNTQLQKLQNDYNANYSTTYDGGYTGDQVAAKVTSTPGYQFEMNQGTKAIERQGAAAGMLGSANTQLALQKFGQDQALNYYNSYMQNLANITQQGMGATMQLSTNQSNLGTALGALSEAGGSAQQQNEINKANAQAQSLYQQGTLYTDVAKYNTGLQYGHTENAAQQAAGAAQSAIGAAPGLLNAGTNRAQFNYTVAQNQQAGQSFYNNGTNKNTGYI